MTAQLHGNSYLEQGQEVQRVERECTTLHYTVYSSQNCVNGLSLIVKDKFKSFESISFLSLYLPEEYQDIIHDFFVLIKLKGCLFGFQYDANKYACVYSPKII